MTSKLKKSFELRSSFAVYEATEILGEGGSGRVYGISDESGQQMACKVLHTSQATAERLRRFKNEYLFCSNAGHPNIIRMTDHGLSDEGAPFVVMPRFDHSLRKSMAEGFAPDQVLPAFAKIIDGVEAAHLKGVTHRDLKPENVLVRASDGSLVVADFGISRFTAEDLYTAVETRKASRLANFAYAAPEQRVRGHKVGPAADLYALGLMLNEMFTHQIPLGTDFATISSIAPEFAYLDDVVARLLRQDPMERYESIGELKKELIGRQNAFVSRQELDAATHRVVKTEDVSDPIIDHPIEIVGVDWKDGVLSLQLSQALNPHWTYAFQDMGSYSSVMGADPRDFRFASRGVSVNSRAQDAQRIIDHFKRWLPKIHARYVMSVHQERAEVERLAREKLVEDTRRAEERATLLRDLKI